MAVAADYLQDLSESLHNFREKDVLCDVIIIASGGVHLSAHSLVLATVSNKLRAAFERTYQGGPVRRANWGYRLTIDDCPVDCVEAVLQFVYTGDIRRDVSKNKLSSRSSTMGKLLRELVMPQVKDQSSLTNTDGPGIPDDELINQIGFPDALGILNVGQKLGLDPTKLASCLHALLKVGNLNIQDSTPYQLFDEDIVLDIVDKDPHTVDSFNLVETIRVTSYMSANTDHATPLPSVDHCYTAATVSGTSDVGQNCGSVVDSKGINSNNVEGRVQNCKSDISKINGEHFFPNFEAGSNKFRDIIEIDVTAANFIPLTNSVLKSVEPSSKVDIGYPVGSIIIGDPTMVQPIGFNADLSNLAFESYAIVKPKEMALKNKKMLSKLRSDAGDSFETSLSDLNKKVNPMTLHKQPLSIQKSKPSLAVNHVNCPILYSFKVSNGEMEDGFTNDNMTLDDDCLANSEFDASKRNSDNNKEDPKSFKNEHSAINITSSLEYPLQDTRDTERDNAVGCQKKDRLNRGGEHHCQTSSKSYQMGNDSIEHESDHSDNKPFQCDVCGRSFARRYTAVEHKRLHSGERPYQCDRCGKRFTTAGDLTKHRRSQHAAVKPHVCSICGKEMNTGREVADHRRLHEGGNRCPVCNKTFTRLHNMKEHIRGTHEGYRPYSCPFCDKHFVYSGSLRFHKKQHWLAGINGSNPKGASTVALSHKEIQLPHSLASEPLCSCRFCGQCFDRNVDLIFHERTFHPIVPDQAKGIFVNDGDPTGLDNSFTVQSQAVAVSLPQKRDESSSSLNVLAGRNCETSTLGFSGSTIIEFVQSNDGAPIGHSLAGSHSGCLQQQMRLEVSSIEDQDFADLGLSAVINFTAGEG